MIVYEYLPPRLDEASENHFSKFLESKESDLIPDMVSLAHTPMGSRRVLPRDCFESASLEMSSSRLIPHLKTCVHTQDSLLREVEFFITRGASQFLCVSGDAAESGSLDSVDAIKNILRHFPNVNCHAAFDPYAASGSLKRERALAKLECGVFSLWTQPVFSLSAIEEMAFVPSSKVFVSVRNLSALSAWPRYLTRLRENPRTASDLLVWTDKKALKMREELLSLGFGLVL